MRVSVKECVRERERECVCVCVCEERESVFNHNLSVRLSIVA